MSQFENHGRDKKNRKYRLLDFHFSGSQTSVFNSSASCRRLLHCSSFNFSFLCSTSFAAFKYLPVTKEMYHIWYTSNRIIGNFDEKKSKWLLSYTKNHILDFVLDHSRRWSDIFCIFDMLRPRKRTNTNPSTLPHARGSPISAVVPDWWRCSILDCTSLKATTYAFVH